MEIITITITMKNYAIFQVLKRWETSKQWRCQETSHKSNLYLSLLVRENFSKTIIFQIVNAITVLQEKNKDWYS